MVDVYPVNALKDNDLETAASLLEKSIAQKNDLRIAYLDLGAVHMQQKQYPAALKTLQRAVDLEPTQPDAHYRLGRVYKALGNTAESEQEFAKTRALHQKADAAVVLEGPLLLYRNKNTPHRGCSFLRSPTATSLC